MIESLTGRRLLIISNNVLSTTRSNGKVVMSYFDCLPKEMIRQLYFSSELPSISGYQYYQITDIDIIKGVLNKGKRGRIIDSVDENNYKLYKQNPPSSIKTPFFRLIREFLWWGKWKSKSLVRWLDDYSPTDVFFVGGDSIFAYTICEYIKKRYNARLCLYVTDDYILPRKKETALASFRRRLVRSKMKECIAETDQFFTISEQMRETYNCIFHKDSYLVTNMTEPLCDKTIPLYDDIVLMYAGSLYYGRATVLRKLADTIYSYNMNSARKAKLKIYTNLTPTDSELSLITVEGASEYCGRLSKDELILEMNKSHILCIVESFEPEQIESTRLSLSTKVSEYLSAGKPILAIGPKEIGTISYLLDSAICVTDLNEIDSIVANLLESDDTKQYYGDIAIKKYQKNHMKEHIQSAFIATVFGTETAPAISKEGL